MSDLVLNDLNAGVRQIVEVALKLGWHGRNEGGRHGKQGVLLERTGSPTIHCPPSSQWNQSKLRSLAHRVVTYADQRLVRTLSEEVRLMETIEGVGRIRELPGAIEPPDPDPEPQKQESEAKPPKQPTYEVRPYILHAGTPSAIESPTALLRRNLQTNEVDFICKQCSWTGPTARSVGTHWGSTLDHPVVRPKQRALRLQQTEFTEPVGGFRTFEERPGHDDKPALPKGAPSAEELVQAIQRIVSADLSLQVETLTEQVGAMTWKLAEVTTERDKLLGRLRTIRETLRHEREEELERLARRESLEED